MLKTYTQVERIPATPIDALRPDLCPARGDMCNFEPTDVGSGAFGRWIIDSAGLPAYSYEFDQYQDQRALYPNSERRARHDHWYQIGNDHITALASNDGTVQVYLGDRGGSFLNRFEAGSDGDKAPRRSPRAPGARQRQNARRQRQQSTHLNHAYAGGFGFLDDGNEVWATAFRYRPSQARTRRVFGMDCYETEMTYRQIDLTRQVYAPQGDDPVLLADVQIKNQRDQAVDLYYYEYWDINVYQLKLEWARTGLFAAIGDRVRHEVNNHFTPSIIWDGPRQALRFHQQPIGQVPLPDQPSDTDWSPADIFLADLSGKADAYYTDKAAFFGEGGPRQPDAVRDRRAGEINPILNESRSCCLVLRRPVHLEPGATIHLRYAYGTVRPGQSFELLEKYCSGNPLDSTLHGWKDQLVYFATGSNPVLSREMAWHAYNLLSATVYNAYYDTHLVPQGSAYLYLHGADGAPRDQALFTLPMVYLRPDLARDMLRLIMRLTHAETGAIPYAMTGYGIHSDAGIHKNPSDLDLFFMLALSEYLAATGDMAFLDEEVPFYPPGARPAMLGTTVLDHVRVAVRHLFNCVGFGEHGLFRIGDGDWNDGIVTETVLQKTQPRLSFLNSTAHGESVPNSQMALHVLPLITSIVADRDPDLAKEIRALLPGLAAAVAAQWNGRWYNRAILRDFHNQPVIVGRDQINLEAQVWALISGAAAESGKIEQLIEEINTRLDAPSKIGAPTLERGEIWPAISQLLTWGYTRFRPDLAWRSLKRNTFAAHAEAFPEIWFDIWTGPDAINSTLAANPGGTWTSPVTPMTDFPAMNANPDAMALLGLLRVCGIEPADDGLLIAPCAPVEHFVLDLPLIRLEVEAGRISGEYRAIVDGSRVLHVRVPEGVVIRGVRVGNSYPSVSLDNQEVRLVLTFQAGQSVPFEVDWESQGNVSQGH
ncbi:MAG TPA: hypothetical protein VMS73_01885 [Anaerolineaceae bacterium]|nr:hypothetical protein [Anaerolineaceae bacterium]